MTKKEEWKQTLERMKSLLDEIGIPHDDEMSNAVAFDIDGVSCVYALGSRSHPEPQFVANGATPEQTIAMIGAMAAVKEVEHAAREAAQREDA